MLFSCIERHVDGSFWFHGYTFNTREQAETFMAGWIPWDPEREKRIIEHETPIKTHYGNCCKFDFHTFEFGGIILCTI